MRGWMMIMALTLPLTALAQTPAAADSSAPAQDGAFGSQTRLWLDTQISGANSVTEERPMPGEVATRVYQRYLNSFTYPIPQRFTSDSFKSTGTGASTSGGTSSP
jgi:hypothetical protein